MKTDINKNASGWSPIPIDGKAKKIGAIDPADPIYPISTGESSKFITPVRNADGGGFKGKFLSKTNSLGITHDDKLNRTFGWGVIAGLLLIVGVKYAHAKGCCFLQKFSFLEKI